LRFFRYVYSIYNVLLQEVSLSYSNFTDLKFEKVVARKEISKHYVDIVVILNAKIIFLLNFFVVY